MQTRRKTSGSSMIGLGAVQPVEIVRSTLTVNRVSTDDAGAGFSDVLVQAVRASQAVGGSHAQYVNPHTRIDAYATANGVHPENSAKAWSPYQQSSTDLYQQLDALFREKSILLAIA